MSDYYGAATLEDWLKEEVFAQNIPVPAEVVAHFEEWREDVERNIEAWMNSDDGDGNNLSWRGWGRGFNAISDEDTARFDALVAKLRPQAKPDTPSASLPIDTRVPIYDTTDQAAQSVHCLARQQRTAWLNRLASKCVFHLNAIEQTYNASLYQKFHDAFFGKSTSI
jgi:hypothetical protein